MSSVNWDRRAMRCTFCTSPYLDGGYDVFGKCMEINVVGKYARVEKRENPEGRGDCPQAGLVKAQETGYCRVAMKHYC